MMTSKGRVAKNPKGKKKAKAAKVALPLSSRAKRAGRKGKAKLQLVKALEGTWSFKAERPVKFRFLRKGSGLRLKLDLPPTLGEEAYRALFRFLSFNFQHLRVKIPYWLQPEVQLALKQVRRKRWRKRHRRYRRNPPPPPPPVPVPPEEDTSVGPSGDLQAIAKQVLKGAKKP